MDSCHTQLNSQKVARVRQLQSSSNNTKCLAVVCTSGPQTGVQHSQFIPFLAQIISGIILSEMFTNIAMLNFRLTSLMTIRPDWRLCISFILGAQWFFQQIYSFTPREATKNRPRSVAVSELEDGTEFLALFFLQVNNCMCSWWILYEAAHRPICWHML